MKWVKWAAIIVVGFIILRWLLDKFAAPVGPQLGDGSIVAGWPYAGPLYARPPIVYPWSPPRPRRRGPTPWRGQSYAGRG